MTSRAIALLMLVSMAALASCKSCDGSAAGQEAGVPGVLRDQLRGVWSVRPAPSAIEKMRGDLRKAARGDERKLEEMVRSFAQSMEGVTLEITDETIITRTYTRQVSTAAYEVVREEGTTITLRVAGGGRAQAREHMFAVERDGSLSGEMEGLGAVVLERRR
jgi:hypothetical protein